MEPWQDCDAVREECAIDVAKRLKERAARNNRSLQGELSEILVEASRVMTFDEIYALAKRLGLSGGPSESAQMIREDRDDPVVDASLLPQRSLVNPKARP